MIEDRLGRQFQLALSWREVLMRQHETNMRRGIDGAHRVSLSKRNAPPAAPAQACIEKLRKRARSEAARAASELRRTLHARERLLDRAASGKKHDAQRLNQTHRRLTQRIETQRARIARLNALVVADTPEQAGGPIELPESEYGNALRKARGSLWQTVPSEDRRTIVLGILATLLAVLGVTAYTRWDDGVRFEVGFTDESHQTIRVRCINDTNTTITLHMPWPEDAPPSRSGQAYGASLYLRTEEEQVFRLLPSAGEAWTHQGTPTLLEEPIEVPPRMATEVMLQIRHLDLPGQEAAEMRLVCTHGGDDEISRFAWMP